MKQMHHSYRIQEQAKTTGKMIQIQLKQPKTNENDPQKLLNNPKHPKTLNLEIWIFY